jgi:phenylacetate-CoA ligase
MTIKYLLSDIKERTLDTLGYIRFGPALDLMQSQWWSHDQLIEFQNQRLQQLLTYAYENIPGYRKKFEAHGIHPRGIQDINDLARLPITTRDELQNNSDFINPRLIDNTLYTGGSTGIPLRYYESFLSSKVRRNAHLRGWRWNGYRPGDRIAVVASAQGSMNTRNALNLRGDLTLENIRKNIESLKAFKPEYLRGYVSSLYLLSRYVVENDIRIEGIRAINPISENLYDHQREFIEQAFHCEVFEEYCANDGGACAWECGEHGGLHQAMERSIVENVGGDLVTTDLWNYAMPFIRYKNGDRVEFQETQCGCGRELSLIKVEGRDNDYIVTPHGSVSPSFLLEHGAGLVGNQRFRSLNFHTGISAVQYVQKPGYSLLVNIVKNDHCNEYQLDRFRKNLEKVLPDMDIRIAEVKAIPATQKGKRHFIINEDTQLLQSLRRDKRLGATEKQETL